MSRRHRPYHIPKRAPYEPPDHCQTCGVKRPSNRLYHYVDGNNYAISHNSPALCFDCYVARYGWRRRPPQEY